MAKSSNFMPVNFMKLVPVDNRTCPMAVEPTQRNAYVAPRIEAVLSANDIEREIFYAGSITPPPWSNFPD